MDNALLALLDERVSAYGAERRRCLQAFDEDPVHDLRVAIRRLLAMVDLLRGPGFGMPARRLRRSLKRQLDGLGKLRDTQVMLQRLELQATQWPGAEPLCHQLRQRERRLCRQARKVLTAVDADKQARRLHKLRARLAGWQGDTGEALQQTLETAHGRWLSRHVQVEEGVVVDDALLEQLHRERVAFKRLRYTVEILQQCDPVPGDRNALAALRDYQTLLGDIQDARVFCRALPGTGCALPARV